MKPGRWPSEAARRKIHWRCAGDIAVCGIDLSVKRDVPTISSVKKYDVTCSKCKRLGSDRSAREASLDLSSMRIEQVAVRMRDLSAENGRLRDENIRLKRLNNTEVMLRMRAQAIIESLAATIEDWRNLKNEVTKK